uniref:CD63 antigen-like n=1 Tax=Ciona intestinalis TaxID=7719 RepID=UPI00089DC93A|nr:CD63 antigen-like [Ciona intestinalis]|eukprot:XP_009860122.2 CD63 antigen-like [Ciona intestinalis]
MASSAKSYRILSCLKILLVIFTVLFLCTGVVFLATGIYALMTLSEYNKLTPMVDLSMTPIVLCASGGFIIISGLFGFVSAFKNNKCMVNTYGCLLGVIFLVEIAGGILSIIYINQIRDSFEVGFRQTMQNYYSSNQALMDKAQIDLQCCGVYSYTEWFNTTWRDNTEQCNGIITRARGDNFSSVPSSCCKSSLASSSGNETLSENRSPDGVCYCGEQADIVNINTQGCVAVMFGSEGQTLYYLISACFGLAALQVIGICLSLCIYQQQRRIRASRRHY